MSLLWGIAHKLLGLQCSSFAQRCSYILSWEWLWSFGRPHSTAKVYKKVPPSSNKMIKICNSGYAQKSPNWDLTFLGIITPWSAERRNSAECGIVRNRANTLDVEKYFCCGLSKIDCLPNFLYIKTHSYAI